MNNATEKRKVLKNIENHAEMESYFHAKVIRTPIEDSDQDLKIELHYTKLLEEDIELAKRIGIPNEEIENARCAGYDKANETVTEADDNGWWN